MKGQLGRNRQDAFEVEPEIEMWTLEMVRQRSEELQLIDSQGIVKPDVKRSESRCEEIILSDHDQSPSKSTTTESQVRSSHTLFLQMLTKYILGDSAFQSYRTRNHSSLQTVS